jgi:hypothetical protein
VCHNYSLLLGNLAASCSQAISFFGVLQRIYVFFAASTHRWNVSKQHVKNLSVKPLSDTRWECRIESVKAIRYQPVEIRDALTQAAAATKEPLSRSEAESLCNEIENFQFTVALVFWHGILFQVNYISKQLQGESSDLSDAIENLDRLSQWLAKYRETGVKVTQSLQQKLLRVWKSILCFLHEECGKQRMFDYEGIDEGDKIAADAQDFFRVNCFNQILDTAVSSINTRSQQLKTIHGLFGFLYKFRLLSKVELMKSAKDLEMALSDGQSSDIDGYMLAEKMEAVKSLIPPSLTQPMDILRHLVKVNEGDDFPNLCIALRILLTIPVTVASGERSFSKLKLIKTYLRASMAQERLNNLAILSIENDVAHSLNFDDVIDIFAARTVKL